MTLAPVPEPAGGVDQTSAAARAGRLFERHGRMVYGICRAMLRDRHEAEDATQQAFLSAYRALIGGVQVRDEGAWLATIARNECRARISSGMRTPLPISDEDLAAIHAPVDEAERYAQTDAIRSALSELPERQREAVVLRDLYGLRYGEVATALGLSRAATEALLFRARRSMRQRLKPAVASVLAVPFAVQEGLAQAIPGFAAAGSGGAVTAGVAGGGLIAKLTASGAGVKVATAAVAVTTAGTVGSVESERAAHDRAERAAQAAMVASDSNGHSGSGIRGSGDDRDFDNSGPGSGSEVEREEAERDSSGPGGGDSGGSGSGGSRRDGRSNSGPSYPSGEPEVDSSGPSSSSGPSGSGSGSAGSGSGSSGSGSGSDADLEP